MIHVPLVKRRHSMLPKGAAPDVYTVCAKCEESWPCEVERLRAEVARLRAVEVKVDAAFYEADVAFYKAHEEKRKREQAEARLEQVTKAARDWVAVHEQFCTGCNDCNWMFALKDALAAAQPKEEKP